ncbi:ribonuclease T2-like [Conger conger]|nr:ribonuclease T2-like [Conger conger]
MGAPLLLVAILLCGHALTCQCTNDVFQMEKSSCTWKCMTFALVWPGAFCAGLKKPLECIIPDAIQSWTIHGLWPMHETGCCGCWPIFRSDLEGLEPQLSRLWPTLVKSRSNMTFWKDEWNKHGTCAACVEGLNSPTQYFQATLKLRGHFDVDRAFMDASIKPTCNQTYKVADLHAALAPIAGDRFEIQCQKDKNGRELLVQLKITMYKNYTLGCDHKQPGPPAHVQTSWKDSPGHPCPQNSPVYYLPISHEHPQNPCD